MCSVFRILRRKDVNPYHVFSLVNLERPHTSVGLTTTTVLTATKSGCGSDVSWTLGPGPSLDGFSGSLEG